MPVTAAGARYPIKYQKPVHSAFFGNIPVAAFLISA
jgi:hypothetical protein